MDELRNRPGLVPGLILIGLGIIFLIFNFFPGVAGSLFLVGLGLTLLVVFLFTRLYGVLIPAGILSGLGFGIVVLESRVFPADRGWPFILIGLGGGFLLIWVFSILFTSGPTTPGGRVWPLIPGVILVLIGAGFLLFEPALWAIWWPLIFVAIAVLELLVRLVTGRLRPGMLVSTLFWCALAALIIASNLGMLPVESWWDLWPLILIFAGLSILWNQVVRRPQ